MKLKQAQMCFNHCIFDHFIMPDNDDWVWELKNKKIERDKQWETIKNILINYENRQRNFKNIG